MSFNVLLDYLNSQGMPYDVNEQDGQRFAVYTNESGHQVVAELNGPGYRILSLDGHPVSRALGV